MKLNITYSPEKDAQNHVNTVYKFRFLKHGREDIQQKLLSKLPSKLQEVITSATSDTDAHDKILKFLKAWQKQQPNLINNSINNLQFYWNKTGSAIIKSLEFFYQKPLPFDEITIYLTMAPISPYSFEGKYIFIFAQIPPMGQVGTILHELNHFMFYHYYPELKDKLGEEKYELLKESLTFFTNPNQIGKPDEDKLRQLYASKNWSSVEEIINAGALLLKPPSTNKNNKKDPR